MKTFYKFLTLSLFMLIYTACGGGNGSSSTTPSSRTINLHVEQASTLTVIPNATVTVYDSTGTQVNSSNVYVTNATGDVSVVITNSDTTYNVKVTANTYTDQVKVIALATSTATLSETVSLLPIGSTLSPAVVGLNIDTSGSGAQVDTTGAIFYDANGVATTVASIDFTPLNPIANPSAFPGTPDITMPGGTPGLMVSSGMIDIVFRDASGNVLTLDSGTPVTIRMPLYSGIHPITGANLVPGNTVRFWSMNPNTGTWDNETNALVVTCGGSPTGLCAEGMVTHFSWWNTDFAVSATRKETLVVNSSTNNPFATAEIESIKLTAKFTEASSGVGRYGPTAIRTSFIEVDDFITVGDNFDTEFMLEVVFSDGSRATKLYEYTWSQISALSEFKFDISKTDQFVNISLSSYENKISPYRTYPIYLQRTLVGIDESNVAMKVNGVVNGNASVGTINCNTSIHVDIGYYCTYTKGTQTGTMNITAESLLDTSVNDSLDIEVLAAPALALKTVGKIGPVGNNTSRNYYNDTSFFLSKAHIQSANNVSDYAFTSAYGTPYKLVLDPAESIALTDYTLSVTCISNAGTACATNEEFTAPFSFDVTKFPATVNGTNKYTLVAVKNSDATVQAELKLYYY